MTTPDMTLLTIANLRPLPVHHLGTAAILLANWHIILIDDELPPPEMEAVMNQAFDQVAASSLAGQSPHPIR